jgi:tRNA A37 threonylcarbamoyladenosine dehydratase
VSNPQERLEILLGEKAIARLATSKVLVMGVGGVGSICSEALVRSGVGNIMLIDGDTVEISNINRQIPALHSTVGRYKAEVMAERLRDINPQAKIESHNLMWAKDSDFVNLADYDYIIDAIDSFAAKMDLIDICTKSGINIISSMGAGGRVDGTKYEVCDIKKTYNDPLAKKVRYELKKRGINKLKVVFSKELPVKAKDGPIGSAMFAVSVAGLLLAGEVIKDLTGDIDE